MMLPRLTDFVIVKDWSLAAPRLPVKLGRRGQHPAACQQECRVFWVPAYVAIQPVDSDVPRAEIRIPTDWLMPWLDLDAVRRAQRPDTTATLTADWLSIAGLELVVERRWLREQFWRQIKQAIGRGYIYKSSAVQVTLRGERREHERRNDTAAAR